MSNHQTPVPLKPDDVSAHLTCAICMNVPAEPSLTPCQHLFCKECLSMHRQTAGPFCPSCRTHNANVTALQSGSLIYRVWSEINVKCGNHDRGCPWTGSIVDAITHMHSCALVDRSKKLLEEIAALKQQLESLRSGRESLRQQLDAAKQELATSRTNESNLSKTNKNLELKLEASKASAKAQLAAVYHDNDVLPKLFVGNYGYNRHSVVKLSQLISRYLENKPNNIDSNRIFNCVSQCYKDLERNYNDNPEFYYVDMRMLLATCDASTWFSNQQRSRISQWMSEQNWSG
ncbi:hypothetical protein MPSEU_000188200 [Mayamaea pseudoterrestris]|nr:hypothetical protein MPSEU_000188200 [Mayamaea pseudoterrestris]